VERIFHLPLRGLLAPGALEVREAQWQGRSHRILFYRLENEEVWGATAAIIEELLTIAAPLL
jgi:hypothetical protein